VRGQDAVPLPVGEFYIYNLIGCEVVTVENRLLGKVNSVLRGGIANDVLVIGEGKHELLLPMVRDVVRDIDIVARRIVVSPTPGLLPGESEEA